MPLHKAAKCEPYQFVKPENNYSYDSRSQFHLYITRCMPSGKITLCHFFARGMCRQGESFNFRHEQGQSTQNHSRTIDAASPAGTVAENSSEAGGPPTGVCRYFLLGYCSQGDTCRYLHPPQAHPDATSSEPNLGERKNDSPKPVLDSRASVPCHFLTLPGGCHNGNCQFLHATDRDGLDKITDQLEALEVDEDVRLLPLDLLRN